METVQEKRDILKRVKKIELKTRHLVNSQFGGQYHSQFKGRGMEFDEVKEYHPGDDVRSIDWNVTAKMSAPYIKRYREERELSLMLVFDASASMMSGSTEMLKREVAAELAAVLAFSASMNGDKVGLMIVSDEVELFLPAKKGRDHVLRIIRELLFFQAKSRNTHLALALKTLSRIALKRGLIFILSDFYDLNFAKPLEMIRRRHQVKALQIADPLEVELPAGGLWRFEDPETGASHWVDMASKKNRESYIETMEEKNRQIERFFSKRGISLFRALSQEDYIEQFARFFRQENRKIRA